MCRQHARCVYHSGPSRSGAVVVLKEVKNNRLFEQAPRVRMCPSVVKYADFPVGERQGWVHLRYAHPEQS